MVIKGILLDCSKSILSVLLSLVAVDSDCEVVDNETSIDISPPDEEDNISYIKKKSSLVSKYSRITSI